MCEITQYQGGDVRYNQINILHVILFGRAHAS